MAKPKFKLKSDQFVVIIAIVFLFLGMYLLNGGFGFELVSNGGTDVDLRRGIVAYYNMSGTGNFIDDTGNYTLSEDVASNRADGIIGYGRDAPSNDFRYTGTAWTIDDSIPFTISGWINTSTDNAQILQQSGSTGDTQATLYTAGNKARWEFYKNGGTNHKIDSTTTVVDSTYHMITGVYHLNGTIELYVDGEKEGTKNYVDGSANANNNIKFLKNVEHGVDEVVIWHDAKSEDEIQELYDRQSNDLSGAQYPFYSEEDSDSTTDDEEPYPGEGSSDIDVDDYEDNKPTAKLRDIFQQIFHGAEIIFEKIMGFF